MAISISLITVTRNNQHGFEKTSQSVLNQSSPQYEWIIIDGASTDGTTEMLSRLPRQNNIHITSEPDGGIYDAMNKGIAQATGDYLLFLNAGDALYSPETLKQICDALHTASGPSLPALIYGDSVEEEGQHLYFKPARSHTSIAKGLFTHHQAMLYNRHSLGDLRYDLHYKIAADYDLTLRFLTEKPRLCLKLNMPICIFEGGGLSQQRVAEGRMEQFKARRNNPRISRIQNIITTQQQAAASALRSICPTLYWKIKSAGKTAPKATP